MAAGIRRHPIRGFLYGIVFGLGLAMIVVGQSWAALGTWPPFLVFLAGIVIGTLWSIYGPPKAPKGTPTEPLAPLTVEPSPAPAQVPVAEPLATPGAPVTGAGTPAPPTVTVDSPPPLPPVPPVPEPPPAVPNGGVFGDLVADPNDPDPDDPDPR